MYSSKRSDISSVVVKEVNMHGQEVHFYFELNNIMESVNDHIRDEAVECHNNIYNFAKQHTNTLQPIIGHNIESCALTIQSGV